MARVVKQMIDVMNENENRTDLAFEEIQSINEKMLTLRKQVLSML